MKNSLLKKLIAVSLAFATLTFAGCQKDEPVNNDENPSESISQNVDVKEEETKDKKEPETSEKTEEKNDKDTTSNKDETTDKEVKVTTVMRETIDLNSVDLTKYGLTKDNDISVPYPTSLGCAYVVRDYGKSKEQTYLFVTTKDKVMYFNTKFPSSGRLPLKGENSLETYSLQTGDLDGEKGEEIVLLVNTGGSGGAGVYCNGIYKIGNGKITEMKISDEAPFEVTLEAPYTVVFKNEKFECEEKIVCETDSELLFDDAGNPQADEYDGGFYAPHTADVYCYDDEEPSVSFTSYSYLSRSVNEKEVYSSVDYIYDSKTKKFVISDVDVWVSDPENFDFIYDIYETEEEYLESRAYMNGYTYYDINKDGVDELITHTGTCEADRVYKIYTFKNGKMYCAGEVGGWHGAMYAKDKKLVVVSTGATMEGSFVSSATYELVGTQLVNKEIFEKEFTDEKELEKYFADLDKTAKEIKINNIYYR